ncbi:MAG TPA: LOG family protein, partial [Candidatus Woesebacteria bacterium]|nr:LOG family protein [Candidatus Woesebacteria bacterium]
MLAKTQKIIKRVALLGDSSAKRYQSHWQAAYQTAKILAQNGYIIVNGGGPGVMLAATLGAKSAKGIVELSIINPQKKPNNFESTHPGNLALADKVYIANTYQERLNRLIDLADAYICFKGGTGTLSEIGLTWGLAKFDYGRHEPLIF